MSKRLWYILHSTWDESIVNIRFSGGIFMDIIYNSIDVCPPKCRDCNSRSRSVKVTILKIDFPRVWIEPTHDNRRKQLFLLITVSVYPSFRERPGPIIPSMCRQDNESWRTQARPLCGCVEIPHRTPPGSTGPHRTPLDPRRFIVPKKVEQINDHLFIDT